MKILIFGGTHFLGPLLSKAFFNEGHQITLFNRGNLNPPLPPVRLIRGDRNSREDLKRLFNQGPWDVAIDNLAYDGISTESIFRLNPPISKYIMTSSVATYRYAKKIKKLYKESDLSHDETQKNEDLTNPHWKYAKGKLDAEKVTLSQTKIPWFIIRPHIVFGPSNPTQRAFWYLARLMDKKGLLIKNSGQNKMKFTFSQDLANVYLRVAQKEAKPNKIYNVASEEDVSLSQWLRDSAKALGVESKFYEMDPHMPEEMGGPFCNMIEIIPDINLAKIELGFRPTPLLKICEVTTKWFKTHVKDFNSLLENRTKEIEEIEKLKRSYNLNLRAS